MSMKKWVDGVMMAVAMWSGVNAVAAKHSEVRAVTPFLKEVTFTEYSMDAAVNMSEKALKSGVAVNGLSAEKAFGCSGAVTKSFFGRNYDWNFSLSDEYVVRVPARPGRHASLGVATGGLMKMDILGGKFLKEKDKMDVLIYHTLDGINDAGVCISLNVVPCGDHGHTVGTNPGGERVPVICFVRKVLDTCGSAKEAIELARRCDIFSVPKMELHCLIADTTGVSYVIEFVDNKIVVLENQRVMTNFYLTDYRGNGVYTQHSEGIERFATLEKGLPNVNSVKDMAKLMSLVNFSAYLKPGNEKTWWSEMNGNANNHRDKFPDSPERFYVNDHKDFKQAEAARMRNFASERVLLERAYDIWIKTEKITPDTEAWITLHSSIYDFEKKTLDLRVMEMDDQPLHFELK